MPTPPGIALAGVVAVAVAGLFAAWVRGPGWSVTHRMAAVAGAVVANSAVGFVVMRHTSTVDLVGNVVVVVAVLTLVVRVGRRAGSGRAPAPSSV